MSTEKGARTGWPTAAWLRNASCKRRRKARSGCGLGGEHRQMQVGKVEGRADRRATHPETSIGDGAAGAQAVLQRRMILRERAALTEAMTSVTRKACERAREG